VHSFVSIPALFVSFWGLFILILLPDTAFARKRFSLEFLPGGALVLPMPLSISQERYADLEFTARYRTESFRLPLHYSIRAGYDLTEKSCLELEFNHLKLFLDNPPPEIQRFSITHGFNQLWLNYSHHFNGFILRAGLGPVIAHPESKIRNNLFDEFGGIGESGYYLGGLTGQLGIQKRFFIGKLFFFSVEGKLNAAWASVPIAFGRARVPVVCGQTLLGVGLNL